MFTRSILLPILCLLGLLCLSGCTDDQLRKSAEAVSTAEDWHARAVRAEQVALDALAQIEILSQQFDSERAAQMIAQAKGYLAAASAGVETAGAAVAAAKTAQEAAQAAHDAGGGTAKTVGAAVFAFAVGVLSLYPKTRGLGLALSQVVRGVQAVRRGSSEEKWKTEIGPKLAESLDDAAKRQVDQILAKLPKVAA